MKTLIKRYQHAWVFAYFLLYLPWYFGLQQRSQVHFHDVYTSIDQSIPFISWFIIPYIYWFAFVALTIAFLFFFYKTDFYKCVAFLFIGMTICLIVFTIYPTSYPHRPEMLNTHTINGFLTNFIYFADKSQNVCPSIHVYNSIGCAIALTKCPRFENSQLMKIIAWGSAIMITLSTMFIKQHSIIDVVTAIGLALILYVIIYKVDYSSFKKENYV